MLRWDVSAIHTRPKVEVLLLTRLVCGCRSAWQIRTS